MPAREVRTMGMIPWSWRSPRGGHSNPLQYSCLENSIDIGAWQTMVPGVSKRWTRLSRRQQYVNRELPDVQAGFRKSRGIIDQIASILWVIKKAKRVPEKHLLLLYWLCHNLWLCGSQQTVENSERDGNARHMTCLLRNLYAGQEARVRTGQGTTDWFQIEKGVCQSCILSLCLFNLHAEYICDKTTVVRYISI